MLEKDPNLKKTWVSFHVFEPSYWSGKGFGHQAVTFFHGTTYHCHQSDTPTIILVFLQLRKPRPLPLGHLQILPPHILHVLLDAQVVPWLQDRFQRRVVDEESGFSGVQLSLGS